MSPKPIVAVDTRLLARRDLKSGYLALTFGPFRRLNKIRPGQFVHIALNLGTVFYRRAFSVNALDAKRKGVEILIKVIGRGTRGLEALRLGDQVNILGPLGNAFTIPTRKQTAVLIAGGVGIPPTLFLAETLVESGVDPGRIVLFYGGRSAEDIVERARIKRLKIRFHPVTEDGSLGQKGLVTSPLKRALSAGEFENPILYSCGPEPMLAAVDRIAQEFHIPAELALEAPMPCGFGICLGCVVPLSGGGFARVCQDGPIFRAGGVDFSQAYN